MPGLEEGPTVDELRRIAHVVRNQFGIVIGEDKQVLVANRLRSFLARKGFNSYQDFIHFLESDANVTILDDIGDLLSTNYTFFYREPEHFETLKKKVLPDLDNLLKDKQSHDLRVWCSAAATGEEPYTIAMFLMEYFGVRYAKYDAGVLATDVSGAALKKAEAGRYHFAQLRTLPPDLVKKYFKQIDHENFQVTPELRKEVLFRKFNLMSSKFPFKKPFHLIFCRNVMIYFDRETRAQLLAKFYDFTAPGGYLFVGHAESVGSEEQRYERISSTVFRRRRNA